MKAVPRSFKIVTLVCAIAFLGGCAAGPAPYYSVSTPAPPPGEESGVLRVGPQDQFYVLHLEDHTPFGLQHLPQSMNVLYEKGYDHVKRERKADFALDIAFFGESRDNPQVRAGQMIGGALLGAATGAIIGGALGSPGRGAAIGAASGGTLGLVAPANTPIVRIDIRTQGLRDDYVSYKSAFVDMANVPPYDVQRVIDIQVSRMLEDLPPR